MAIVGGLRVGYGAVLAKSEASYGTDATPAGTDAVLHLGTVKRSVEYTTHDNPAANVFGYPEPHRIGSKYRKLAFDIPIKGSGSAGTAPEAGPLLKACGFKETTTPATSVVYTLSLGDATSATVCYYMDGKLYKLCGCFGSINFEATAGGILVGHVEMSGLWQVPTDAALVAPTYDSTEANKWLAPTLTWDASALLVRKVSFGTGGKIAACTSVNDVTGVHSLRLCGFDPTGSLTVEDDLEAGYAFETKCNADTSSSLTWTHGSAGNIVTVTMANTRAKGISHAEEDGIATLEIPLGFYDLTHSASTSPIKLAFT